MKGRAARGGTEIAGSAGDRRKYVWGDTTLFREKGHEAGIGLMRRKASHGSARDSAAQLNGGDRFFHAGDGRAGKGFTVELHGEATIFRIIDLNRRCVLPRATEKKIAEPITRVVFTARGRTKDESAGAVAKEPAEFAGNPAGGEGAAVDVSSDNGNHLGLSRSEKRLRDRQSVEQAEASTANVERTTIFTDEQARVELRRKWRVVVMCFAGGDDPVELIRGAKSGPQRFLRGSRAQCQLVFLISGISQRFDAGAIAKLAGRHAEGTIDVFRRQDPRTSYSG